MFPVQLPVMRPDEFSRCDEHTDQGNAASPTQRSDASLKASVERAIWKDEVLRAIEYYAIDVRAKDGIVHLNGHIANTTSRIRIENAIRSVPGIVGVRNHLVLDEKLTLDVAGALGTLEHTHGCKFFIGSSHGVISINGIVSNENVKLLAEMSVARNPNVRAVINHVRVSGAIGPELQDLPFLQPIIGETIYFLDGLSGVVERVIIDPNNRRVIAMLLLLNFTDPRLPVNSLTEGRTRLPVQLVQVPMDTIRYLTKVSGFLLINSHERSRYQDFDPACFFAPDAGWTPPYPYCPQDVLFPVTDRKTDAQTLDVTHPFPFEELLEGASFKEQFFATDNLDR
jgi:osmotically-inducible protein OsmY